MWNHCGVIKNDKLLREGIDKVKNLKNQLIDVDVRIDQYNCEDLTLISDLRSSLCSAEATLISALERNESRGAHQRDDFAKTNINFDFNCLVQLNKENNDLEVTKIPLKKVKEHLKTLISFPNKDVDIKNKLLE